MRITKKILIAGAGIIMTASLVYGVNNVKENLFDEIKWEETVQQTDPSLFYAPHNKDGIYFNPWLPMNRKSFFTVLKWRFFTEKAAYSEEEESFLPGIKPLTSGFINTNDNFMTWIGHASVLIKASGNLFIIDPVLGDIPFVKKRRVPAALSYSGAAELHGNVTVLITHNHYDHLDEKSVKSFPAQTKFIVPAGLKGEIGKMRGSEAGISEIDWWEENTLNGIKISFLPSQHWSKRIFSDPDSSLWGSFLVDTGGKRIFICGDTGYSGLFKEIGKKFPGIDYAFISAGAYHPRWFMHYAHMNDSEAVKAFYDLGAKKMIPLHWGSFRLGDEPEGHPGVHIKKKLPDAMIMNHGETLYF